MNDTFTANCNNSVFIEGIGNIDFSVFAENINLKLDIECSLYSFLKEYWNVIESVDFVSGMHIEALCQHLEAVAKGEIKNLLINMPPRCCKSTITSVIFPAWVWITNPCKKFLYSSYAQTLAHEHSVKCRRLITSDLYKERFGDRYFLTKDQNAKSAFENNKGGYRIAASVGSSITGKGANFVIADDPNNVKDISSDKLLQTTIQWWTEVMSTRLNDQKTDSKIIIQQRCHTQDLSGFIIANDVNSEWEKLIFPMRYVGLRKTITKIWQDPRKEEGELLWSSRFPLEIVESLERALGVMASAGQLQQTPVAAEGNIVKKEWFKLWKNPTLPKIEFTLQSWDTAMSAKKTACFSACSTWGVFYDENNIAQVILLGLWRGKEDYPELKKIAKRLYFDYRDTGKEKNPAFYGKKVNCCIIEAKASGDPLIQDLRAEGINALPFHVNRGAESNDKIKRFQLIASLIEEGRVWLPTLAPEHSYLTEFAELLQFCCIAFPAHDAKDVVDTMSQALLKLMEYKIFDPNSRFNNSELQKIYFGYAV